MGTNGERGRRGLQLFMEAQLFMFYKLPKFGAFSRGRPTKSTGEKNTLLVDMVNFLANIRDLEFFCMYLMLILTKIQILYKFSSTNYHITWHGVREHNLSLTKLLV